MRNLLLLVLLFVLLANSSCGPSEAERQAAQERRDDSVRIATEQRILAIKELENTIQIAKQELENRKAELMHTKASLEVARDEMNRIKGFQLGRTSADRDQQIRSQSHVIQNTEAAIIELTNSIPEKEDEIENLTRQLNSM